MEASYDGPGAWRQAIRECRVAEIETTLRLLADWLEDRVRLLPPDHAAR